MRVLGIETSCDETAAAVVEVVDVVGDVQRSRGGYGDQRILSNVVHSQVSVHAPFGGIVPEVASREHINRIVEIVEQAVGEAGGFEGIDGIAVTSGPGLIGSLLVGVQFAKGLAMARDLPWVGINHLEGHLCASRLADSPPSYPHLALVVSGGHTHLYEVAAFGQYLLLGGTRDDAAGEAFDKVAKLLGLGYPGGVEIERLAATGNPHAVALPRALPNKKLPEFSFSGLKTAAALHLRGCGEQLSGPVLHDFCASLQEAICDALSKKAVVTAQRLELPGVVLAGGVAANSRLREMLAERAEAAGLWAFAPPKALCTDNAAMIAAAGCLRLAAGERSEWLLRARSRWPLGAENSSASGRGQVSPKQP